MSLRKHAIALAVAGAFQHPLLAQELPAGGNVTHGQATISQSPGFMQIQQASDKAVIDWQSFSIGAGGQVNFSQPASSSVALNRVLGNNPSSIFGMLSANGRVFLVNPSGILFAPGAQVSVGGLVASTLSITDQDFLDGNYVFSNAGGAGSVVNQGSINSFGGYTALLAPRVTNEGFIFAHMGNVALAAGDRVSLDMVGDNLIRVNVEQAALDAAVLNRGQLEAFGGNVLLRAHSANALLDTVLNTEGYVRASSMTMVDGEIVLDGGSRGATRIGGQVTSDGHMSIAGADVTVTGYAWSMRGQDVAARSLSVIGRDGAVASLSSQGGDQVIAIVGDGASAGLDLIVDGGLAAQIQQFDAGYGQVITVVDADHINVDGRTAGPGMFPATAGIFASGAQSISISGGGRNAITVGSSGATGSAGISAPSQSITAGVGAESGSISLTGSSGPNAFVGISAGFAPGPDTQVIRTTGALRVVGAEAPALNAATGVFHNALGQQTVRAGSIELVAGSSGSGNGAFINANGGGHQHIEVAGGPITVAAGDGGSNNGAGIISRGSQSIVGRPDIAISGGAGGNASVQGLGAFQHIEADDVFLTNAASGPINSAGVILGAHQHIDATGDVTLVARSGTGTASGVRIGGAGAGATDLLLTVQGNVVLTGGTTGTNGAALGGAGTVPTGSNNINVDVAGDLILDGAVGGGGVRIGSSAATPVQAGNMSVTASRIEFRGTAPAAIRTLGNVELNAGTIEQGPNGLILANALATTSTGSTVLAGSNNVSSFTGAAGGDLLLRNLSPFLTLGPVEAAGLLSIDQAGSLLIQAADAPLVVRGGLVNVATGADLLLAGGSADGAQALLSSGGNVGLTVGGTLRLEEGSGKFAAARVQSESRDGVITLSFPNLISGGVYVNSVEGDTKDGKSGFFVVHKPAKTGDDLLLEYGE